MLFYGTRDGARSALTVDGGMVRTIFYRVEARRGYDSLDALWSPGYFSADLLLVGTPPWWPQRRRGRPSWRCTPMKRWRRRASGYGAPLAAAHPLAQTDIAAELVLAADQCIITRPGRIRMRSGPARLATRCAPSSLATTGLTIGAAIP